MGKFVITKRKNGQYQFNLIAKNGKVILTSEGYITKINCQRGVDSVKINSFDDAKYEHKTATNGNCYFNLKAKNGEIIGTSEMYLSKASCNKGILSVKTNASRAVIKDESD